jgi:hypothetical protein
MDKTIKVTMDLQQWCNLMRHLGAAEGALNALRYSGSVQLTDKQREGVDYIIDNLEHSVDLLMQSRHQGD